MCSVNLRLQSKGLRKQHSDWRTIESVASNVRYECLVGPVWFVAQSGGMSSPHVLDIFKTPLTQCQATHHGGRQVETSLWDHLVIEDLPDSWGVYMYVHSGTKVSVAFKGNVNVSNLSLT